MNGVGKNQWNVSLAEIPIIIKVSKSYLGVHRHDTHNLKYGRIQSIVSPPAIFFIKLSLLLLYLRIFGPDKVTRYLIHFGIASIFTAYIIVMFLNIFTDVEDLIKSNKLIGAINLASDIYIICVPIMAVSKLQLSTKKRIGVILIFLSGTLYGFLDFSIGQTRLNNRIVPAL